MRLCRQGAPLRSGRWAWFGMRTQAERAMLVTVAPSLSRVTIAWRSSH